MAPIKIDTIKFQKCHLFESCPLAAIDCGRSLMKILLFNKRDQTQFMNKKEQLMTLEVCLFRNEDFIEALEWIKRNAYQICRDNNKVHITGTFANDNLGKIKSILNRDVIYFDEFMTIKVGHKVALECIGIEKILVKHVSEECAEHLEMEIFKKYFSSLKSKPQNDTESLGKSSFYPCLFNVHGSICGFLYFDKCGIPEFHEVVDGNSMNFLGLAKCILDTNNYEEIIDLASRGNLNNVDTQMKELFDVTSINPYGKFPPDMPIFSFGKCIDHNKGKEDFNKEDLALSLISLHMNNLLTQCIEYSVLKNVSKIYLTGNLFTSDIFQCQLRKIEQIFPSNMEINFLNFGYFGALGAMVYEAWEKHENIKLWI